MSVQLVHDDDLSPARGFSHGVLSSGGRLLFIAGQIAMDRNGAPIAKGDMVGQFRAAIHNFAKVLKAGGSSPDQVLKLTIFVRDMAAYQQNSKAIGLAYREVFGKHYPAMTMVQITTLVREEYLIEIEGIAAA